MLYNRRDAISEKSVETAIAEGQRRLLHDPVDERGLLVASLVAGSRQEIHDFVLAILQLLAIHDITHINSPGSRPSRVRDI